jgi:hypothetical protein
MGLFKKRPDVGTLERTRAALARELAELIELVATRAQRLLDDEDVAAVAQIDRQIEAHKLTAAALRDRIPLIETNLHQQAVEDLERRRQAAVTTIAEDLRKRDALADQLETATAKVAQLFVAIHASIELTRAKWPFPVSPAAGWADDNLAGEVLGALQRQTRAVGGVFPRHTWAGVSRLLCGEGIKARITTHSARLLNSLRSAPLPDPKSETDDEQESEAA